MSWAAHQFEGYVLQHHAGKAFTVSYLAIVAGDQLADFFSKEWVYGFTIDGHHYGASDPATFHRGWPGFGFTHSLAFGVFLALVVWLAGRPRPWAASWALGILIGQWAHAITDINDSRGTMLLFPFTTHNFSIGTWAYGAQVGNYEHGAAYYSSLGFVMDLAWLIILLCTWRVLTRDYFLRIVRPADLAAWNWIGRRVPEAGQLAIYRAMFVYAFARLITWTTWAHAVEHYAWDLSWTGPYWLPKVAPARQSWMWAITGVIGVAAAVELLWLVALRRRSRVIPLASIQPRPAGGWWVRNQGWVLYPLAVLTYVPVGIVFHSVLNWIVGPAWVLATVWFVPTALEKLFRADDVAALG